MINVLYEDNHILVVEKPVNIPVQEDSSKDEDLLTILKSYIKEKYSKPGNVYLGLVHRLDRPVGGVMLFAKTSKAASRLSDSFKKNEVRKEYYAVVLGVPPLEGKLIDNITKDEKRNMSFVDKNGKYAELDYKVIKTISEMSLLNVSLVTGRSHQIRVQFSSRGYPLYGDQKYNENKKKDSIALYSKRLSFTHPVTKQDMSFELDIPDKYPFNLFRDNYVNK